MTAGSVTQSFDDLVRALEQRGVPRHRAELVAQRELKIPSPSARIVDDAEREQLEKTIELACDRLVLACGGRVIKFSHPGKTKQTPGIADRLYTFPRRKLAVWWEVKSPTGQQRPDQRTFQEDVVAGGQRYCLGGLGDLKQWLVLHGVVARFDDAGAPILERGAPRRDDQAPMKERALVAAIETSERNVVTVDLLPSTNRSNVRIQLNRRRADGTLQPKPLRIVFAARWIPTVIAALQKAQNIIAAAVPVSTTPSPQRVEHHD